MATINEKNIGDIVLVNEPGKTGVEYLVLQKGVPETNYSTDCDGVWLMRKNALPARAFDSTDNDFEHSDLYAYLKNTFFPATSAADKSLYFKMPYYKGNGTLNTSNGGGIQNGPDKGMMTYCFIPASTELGFTSVNHQKTPPTGRWLSYFINNGGNSGRKCKYDDGTAASWWLRSPVMESARNVYYINESGEYTLADCTTTAGVRPCFIVNKKMRVDMNGYLAPENADPVITSDKTGNLGTLTNGFTCNYSVYDENPEDILTVSLKLDNSVIKSFTGVRNRAETYTLGGEDWLRIKNGSHTFKISVNDGGVVTEKTATFMRNCNSLTVTLTTPLHTKKLASVFNLKIKGNIPNDAEIKCEACNNANDDEPAWEDVTPRFKSGLNHIFKNKEAQNGYDVNFRFTVKRGSSNTGGFIEKIICGYE